MKTTITAMTALFAALLVLSPLAAAASPAVSVGTGNTSYTGTQTVTVTITATGFTSLSGTSAAITVTNPYGITVFSEPKDISSGTATDSLEAGVNQNWVSGFYTVSANVQGTIGTATFGYTSTQGGGSGSYNITKALINIQGNITLIENQLTALQASGATEQKDMKANFTAISSALSTLTSGLSTLTSNVNTLTGDVTTLSGSVSQIQNSLTALTGTVNTINTNVQNLGTQVSNAATQATDAVNAANSTQTYVLVVAVLAAITLVLELAILVRKLS